MNPICHRVAFREVFKRKSGNAWIQEVCNEDCNKKVIKESGKRNHNLNIADDNHNHYERNKFVSCATLNLHYIWYRVKYTFKTMVVSKSTDE